MEVSDGTGEGAIGTYIVDALPDSLLCAHATLK